MDVDQKPKKKVYKIKEVLREKVRLRVSGSKRVIDNAKGAWYEVVWYSNGDFELHALSPCGINGGISHIPFNPMQHESFNQYGWGDEKNHNDQEE